MEFKDIEEDSTDPADESSKIDHLQEAGNSISTRLAAIESHKRSRTAFYISIMGIGSTVTTAVFTSMTPWAGAAAACIFSGTFAMLGVRAIKDSKRLEVEYDIGKRKVKANE